MKKILFLVLALSASARPLMQDEHLPDHVVKQDVLPVVKKEATVQLTEAEEAPVMKDVPVAKSDVLMPESVLLGLEATEEHKETEETPVLLEEPVLAADYLTEEMAEEELEPEPQLLVIQNNINIVPVEESAAELEPVEMEDKKEENVANEEPTLEADYIVVEDPMQEMDPGRERRMTLKNGRWTCRGFITQGKCYQFFRRGLNADTAELQCQNICPNGHLASVTSSVIRDEMGRLMDRYGGRTRAWLGGRRIIGTNIFIWLDGTPWSYNGWNVGEPNNAENGTENCVETWDNLAFNDVPCSMLRPFFCSCPV